VHGTIRAHQLLVPVATGAVHIRQRVSGRRIHVQHRVRRDYCHLGEKETHRLQQHGHVVRLLRDQDHQALVLAPVRTLRHKKGILMLE